MTSSDERRPPASRPDHPAVGGWLSLAGTGVALILLGLGWDAVMHAADPGLAAEEGPLTWSNPAHLLSLGGVVLVAVGVGGTSLRLWGTRGATDRRPARTRAAVAAGGAVGVLALAGGALALAGTVPGHGRASGHDHQPQYPDVEAASDGQRAAAQTLLDRTRETAGRFAAVESAEAAGYGVRKAVGRRRARTGKPVPFPHAGNKEHKRDGRSLDPARPESLIYGRRPDGELALVGVLYVMPKGEPGPEIGGTITRWHAHTKCVEASDGPGRRRAKPSPRGKVKPSSDGSCPEGREAREGPAMMHVWLTGDLRTAFARRAPKQALAERLGRKGGAPDG